MNGTYVKRKVRKLERKMATLKKDVEELKEETNVFMNRLEKMKQC